jgi:hypothetical protein
MLKAAYNESVNYDFLNPTNGSCGSFKSSLILQALGFRLDLNHPQNAVGGFQKHVQGQICSLDLKLPPTSVDGIFDSRGKA